MTLEQYQKELLKVLEKASNDFEKELPGAEREMLRRVELLVKDIELRDGKIINSVTNLRLIGKIRQELEKAVLSPRYLAAVQEFVNVFDTVADLHREYFRTNFNKQPPKELLETLQKQAKDAVVDRLIGRGFDAAVVLELEDVLRKNITSGGSYEQLTSNLRALLVSSAGANASLSWVSSYAKTLVIDSINQFSAEYHESIQKSLDLDWFMYVGSNLTTTREFCELLTKKKYIHRSELPGIVGGVIDGVKVKLNPKTKLWYGAIEGTNVANFRVNRGGHRCGHQLIAVSEKVVPKEIRDRYK